MSWPVLVVLAAQEHLLGAECQARRACGLLPHMVSGFMCSLGMLPTHTIKISRGFLAAALPTPPVRVGLDSLGIRGMEELWSLVSLGMEGLVPLDSLVTEELVSLDNQCLEDLVPQGSLVMEELVPLGSLVMEELVSLVNQGQEQLPPCVWVSLAQSPAPR